LSAYSRRLERRLDPVHLAPTKLAVQ